MNAEKIRPARSGEGIRSGGFGRAGTGWCIAGAVALIALLLALAMPVAAGATVTGFEPFNQFGSEGSAAGQLEGTAGAAMATDPVTGDLYVASLASQARRIDEFTPWGEFVKAFGYDVAPGAVNEQQEVRVRASDGQFRLGFGASITADLPYDAGGAEVEAALQALPSIAGAGTVSVRANPGATTGSTPYVYVVTFEGALGGTNVPQLSAENGSTPLSGGDPGTELEVRTRADGTAGGTGPEACTAESGCQKGTRGTLGGEIYQPSGLAVDKAGNVYVYENANTGVADPATGIQGYAQDLRVQKFDSAGRFLLAYGGDVISDGAAGTGDLSAGSTEISDAKTTSRAFEVGQRISGTGIPAGTTIAGLGIGTITLSQPATASGSGVAISAPAGAGNVAGNETQTLSLRASGGGAPTGGTFTLEFIARPPSYAVQTSAPIPAGANAAELQLALEEMPAIGAGNVAVSGAAGGPWTIEFTGTRFAGADVYPLAADASQLLPAGTTAELTSANPVEICTVAADCRGGAPGTNDGQFEQGQSFGAENYIATAPDGTLYVADRNRIQYFEPNGGLAGQFALPQAGNPKSMALDPTGTNLYFVYLNTREVQFGGRPGVLKLSATSGELLGELANERPYGLAVDEDGTVYSVRGEGNSGGSGFEVLPFDPAGNAQSSCCQTESTPTGDNGAKFKITAIAANGAGALYALNTYPDEGMFVRAYGAPPNRFESPPPVAPDIEAQYAASVAAESAILGAQINPHFWVDTRYYLQYGTAACVEAGWGASCVEEQPAPPGNVLSSKPVGKGISTQAIAVTGLAPETTYRFRFVADSTGGGPVAGRGGTVGSDGAAATFTTPPLRAAPATDCPNQAVRYGPSLTLPDCRAYEMVSPVDKNGGNIITTGNLTGHWAALDQSSADGGRITYSSYRPFAGAPSSPATSQYVANRGPEGWTTQSLNAPEGNSVNSFAAIMTDAEYRFFTPDLGRGFMLFHSDPLTANAAPGLLNFYRRDVAGGGFTPLIVSADSAFDQSESKGYARFLNLGAVSENGQHAAFTYSGRLTEDAQERSNDLVGTGQLYEWSNRRGLKLASILPSGLPASGQASAGSLMSLQGGLETRQANVVNALSADGSYLYWSTKGAQSGSTTTVYVRVEGEATLPVSQLISSESAEFLQASRDGSRAAIMTVNGHGVKALYLVEPEAVAVTKVAGEVTGFMGASQNLDYLYFVSREDLAAGATAGAGNLYVDHDGEITYVTTLTGTDATGSQTEPEVSDVAEEPWKRTSRITPDGRHAVFMSTDSLTGYDNVDTASGERDAEAYLYDAPAKKLLCVSCDPTGARPSGSRLYPNGSTEARRRKPRSAAWIPTWAMQFYAQRVLSDNGNRVFFNSFVPLVPQDNNGMQDVYEWEANGTGSCRKADGCIELISTGQSSADSEFVDASADGNDVFIRTSSSLDPRDPGSIDIYDARVGGASQPEQARRSPCVGDSCQSPPQAPSWSNPASSSFDGAGNKAGSERKVSHRKAGRHCRAGSARAATLRRRARALRRRARAETDSGRAKRQLRKSRRLSAKADKISKSGKHCAKTNRRAAR